MMNTVTHEIPFSFRQPDQILSSMMKLIQQRLRQPPALATSREMTVRNALTILIIDAQRDRAQYIASLFITVGYRPFIVPSALDAYTLFLQGECLPLALILGQDDGGNSLFLMRLVQQIAQKHDWNVVQIRLTTATTSKQGYPTTPGTAPLIESNPDNPYAANGIKTPNPPPFMNTPKSGGAQSERTRGNSAPSWSNQEEATSNSGFSQNNRNSGGTSSPNWQVPNGGQASGINYPAQQPRVGGPAYPPQQVPNVQSEANTQLPPFGGQVPNPPQGQGPVNMSAYNAQVARVEPGKQESGSGWQAGAESGNQSLSGLPVFGGTGGLKEGGKIYRVDISKQTQKEKVSLEGQSIGRYQIKTRLGSTPFSDVYQSYDRLREQESALKAVQTDIAPFFLMDEIEEDISAFQLEADIIAKVQHPHILPVLNNGKSYVSGTPFVYKNMPLCTEGSLATWMYRNGGMGSFGYKDVLPVVLQIADAVQNMHNYQYTYQNFKLSNVLVLKPTKSIKKLEVAISDISIVQNGSYIPSAQDAFYYLAPERWEGISVPASDQYSLAALAYEIFTGRPPFQGTSERVLRILHSTKMPQPPTSVNAKLPTALNAVLLGALTKKPSERFASIAHFVQALQRC